MKTEIKYLQVKAFDPETGEEVKNFNITQVLNSGNLIGQRKGIISSHEMQMLELRATQPPTAQRWIYKDERAGEILNAFLEGENDTSPLIGISKKLLRQLVIFSMDSPPPVSEECLLVDLHEHYRIFCGDKYCRNCGQQLTNPE